MSELQRFFFGEKENGLFLFSGEKRGRCRTQKFHRIVGMLHGVSAECQCFSAAGPGPSRSSPTIRGFAEPLYVCLERSDPQGVGIMRRLLSPRRLALQARITRSYMQSNRICGCAPPALPCLSIKSTGGAGSLQPPAASRRSLHRIYSYSFAPSSAGGCKEPAPPALPARASVLGAGSAWECGWRRVFAG